MSMDLYTVVISDVRINGVLTYKVRRGLINQKTEPISDNLKKRHRKLNRLL